jgi:hypothetical protein
MAPGGSRRWCRDQAGAEVRPAQLQVVAGHMDRVHRQERPEDSAGHPQAREHRDDARTIRSGRAAGSHRRSGALS